MSAVTPFLTATLAANVRRGDHRITVVLRARLGDEIVYVVATRPEPAGRLPNLRPRRSTFEVLRGQDGTVAVDHPAGTEIEFL